MNTPRAHPQTASARATPASRSSAAQQDPYYSGRSDQSTLPYRSPAPNSSPYSERQDSARTSVPFNTPELASGFDIDRSRENAGSTPGAGPQKKTDKRIFSEPQTAFAREDTRQTRQPTQSRSAGALAQPAEASAPPMSREDSAIINRLVIADPQEDVERERARVAEAQPVHHHVPDVTPITGLGLVGSEGVPDNAHAQPAPPVQQRSRQEHLRNAQPKRETKFGDYILGQTIGEGEFGKVKLGWKKDGGIQVAIKLIRRDTLGNNPNRLPKIYREIAILRGLQHPNIVRLHEMVETERHIGIILEYASGGELFDYILNHRYLKDHAARRLFAQLVSGVGYLHRKGIVHRDLKLENLLLDRNKNIIITDFGFANTFNPHDELGEEIEYNLSNKDFVQRTGLEQVRSDGHRRGDLMQTSCGSPCYAAPELVVSDSLYTGRKVDVWSCGVILYAMLAGYLPFDDDPANPEGDNINLLYKYIVSTPLTFPEYVTPHARDLLRRILVPDPRKRADLFEVARHSWLSDYAHVVSFITSTTTGNVETNQPAVTSDPYESQAASGLGRSASVREPAKPSPMIGAPARSPNMPSAEERQKKDRDAKRRTVQVEYVAPQSATVRGEAPQHSPYTSAQAAAAPQPKTRARGDSASRPVESAPGSATAPDMPAASSANQRPVTLNAMGPPTRSTRIEVPRAVSDSSAFVGSPVSSSAGRPSTRGSMGGTARLPSRGNSYGQPAAATVAPTNVEGRFSQPQRSSVVITNPEMIGRDPETGRPLSQQFSGNYQPRIAGEPTRPKHKRTNTVESITNKLFGRSNSTRRQSSSAEGSAHRHEKKNRQYPPVSMKNSAFNDPENVGPRRSTDSRRSSIGFGRKEEDSNNKRASKRFSFIPQAFSRMSLVGSKDESPTDGKRPAAQTPPSRRHDSKMLSGMAFGQGRSRSPSQETSNSSIPVLYDSQLDRPRTMPAHSGPQRGVTSPDLATFSPQSQYSQGNSSQQQTPQMSYRPVSSQHQDRFYTPNQSQETQVTDASLHPSYHNQRPGYQPAFGEVEAQQSRPAPRQHATLQKPNRKFGEESGAGGSSSGARRVMNWFRSRGRERGG
ncbi:Pkinase-domain-containing protein [Myriangium duriaei CBS 260.36]|uniref:non-specific serine/threonine protein kinase n=1 Tax=Myriangium duriaei CBS 260.36 TaxID=1168546 RepID=A0A9P4MJI0_9PEZI|nr:Pkinase-domain-containing protein [Myriangium duriaei CBS 260.36]